ncbi:MAG: hypothetical protein RR840_10035 [Clostridium sp.]
MSILVFIGYGAFAIYDISKLKKEGAKKDMWVYIVFMSIPVILSTLLCLNFTLPDVSVYLSSIINYIKSIIGVNI